MYKISAFCFLFVITAEAYELYKIKSSTNSSDHCVYERNDKKCDLNYSYRTFDGSCNNKENPWWGSYATPFKRILDPVFDDENNNKPKQKSVTGNILPSARTIAMKIHHSNDTNGSNQYSNYSNYLTHFSQFISHDLAFTFEYKKPSKTRTCPCSNNAIDFDQECIPILIPREDIFNKDQECFEVFRSAAALPNIMKNNCKKTATKSFREQLNNNTHWLDLSQIYDKTVSNNKYLRSLVNGLLKTSSNEHGKKAYMSYTLDGSCSITRDSPCFQTGDMRVNSNTLLLSMHTIFVREHNRIASLLLAKSNNSSDEETFQISRKILNAIYQHIIYNEWLPLLISREVCQLYDLIPLKDDYFYGYESTLYPAISNEFSTAAFRFGHALVRSSFSKADINYNSTLYHASLLKDTTFNTWSLFQNNSNVDFYLRGSLSEGARRYGPSLNSVMNDKLFEEMNFTNIFSNKRDSMSALDINRGRDHGLPGYNKYREVCGLKKAKTFDDLNEEIPESVVSELKEVFEHVDDIDLFTGGLSEKPIKSGLVGPTYACIIAKQFRDLKFGDSFYYENGNNNLTRFTREQLNEIRQVSMSRLLCDNIEIDEIQKNPFLLVNIENNPLIKCNTIRKLSIDPWKLI